MLIVTERSAGRDQNASGLSKIVYLSGWFYDKSFKRLPSTKMTSTSEDLKFWFQDFKFVLSFRLYIYRPYLGIGGEAGACQSSSAHCFLEKALRAVLNLIRPQSSPESHSEAH